MKFWVAADERQKSRALCSNYERAIYHADKITIRWDASRVGYKDTWDACENCHMFSNRVLLRSSYFFSHARLRECRIRS